MVSCVPFFRIPRAAGVAEIATGNALASAMFAINLNLTDSQQSDGACGEAELWSITSLPT